MKDLTDVQIFQISQQLSSTQHVIWTRVRAQLKDHPSFLLGPILVLLSLFLHSVICKN